MFESDNLTILISLISIVIAISSVFFSIGLQRFELKSIYRSELLNWYKETIEIIFELNYSANQIDNERNKNLLSRLSTNIELGRFFFPNVIDEKNKKEEETKQIAFRGKRHLTLDCLIGIFEIYYNDKSESYKDEIRLLHKQFTSEIFYVLDPKKYQNLIRKHKIANDADRKSFIEMMEFSPEEFSEKIKENG